MNYVTYLRVSTNKQGETRLGLEAQKEVVERYIQSKGGSLVQEYVEVESGKRADRPELKYALAKAKSTQSTLLIAKLDRLSRSVLFIASLMDAGVEFVACDMPEANRLTLHIMAAFAEHERRAISERTKAALAAAKRRGQKLGNPNIEKAREAKAKKGAIRADRNLDIIQVFLDKGYTRKRIAEELNKNNVPSPNGGRWHATSVQREIVKETRV